ncbi:211666b7-40a4-449d-b452-15af02ace3c9 [Thermothielavioides terrestris]|uniref:211666b7-40a4-449d-b452-15af02ace3c9 n=1 Tax=Thermothielavioides terrestris TaxID=2587410 RepID=A0A446BX42_9PEZI|nr:211666b7-40a4-449d-b452-15af02ace3c9 [Thermothielavioides terrestris]
MIVFNALSTAVALATAAAAQGTFTPCTAPYDVCGWTLHYPPEILAAAARAAGQDSDNRDVIYNSIYNCLDADGDIAWNHLCQNGCNAGGDTGPNAECR